MPSGYLDVAYGYPYSFSLTANQLSLGNPASIQTDADFMFRGLIFTSDGTFQVRLYDGQQYALSTGFINSLCLPNSAGDPYPFVPEVWYPPEGGLPLTFRLSGSGNTGQLLFLGANGTGTKTVDRRERKKLAMYVYITPDGFERLLLPPLSVFDPAAYGFVNGGSYTYIPIEIQDYDFVLRMHARRRPVSPSHWRGIGVGHGAGLYDAQTRLFYRHAYQRVDRR